VAHLLGAQAVSVAFLGRSVLSQVSLGLADGDRVGVVGRNGDGKSTLLGALAGIVKPDAGRVTHPANATVGLLEQSDLVDTQATVRQLVVGEAPDHVWAAQPGTREVVTALLSDISLDAAVATLSGGQRRRAALAQILLDNWDVLCLDEPTNHLDMVAINWLAGHLRQRWPASRGALVVVTHDRWFLDQVATTTWEVQGGQVTPFEGGYAAYVLRRVERERQAAEAAGRRLNLLRKELAWLRRGPPARTSKPKFRLDAAAALIADEPPPRNQIELQRLAMTRLGKDVVDLQGIEAGYGQGPVLQAVDWLIGPGDRLGVLGANGAGKTTLLQVISGALAPTAGRVKRGKTVRLATLHQDLRELAEFEHLPVREVVAGLKAAYQAGGRAAGSWTGGGRDARPGWSAGSQEMTPSALLERLGLGPAHLATLVKDLSGGERRRLQLVLVLATEPNVLILDEPTNDLDTDMLAAVEDLLDGWPGTLLVVTHDRYLMERVTDSQYAILDGHLRHLPGGVEQFLDLAAGRPAPSLGKGEVPAQGPASAAKAIRETKKQLAAVERRLARLKEEHLAVMATMAEVDPTDYSVLSELAAKLDELSGAIAAAEDHWLELSEAASQ